MARKAEIKIKLPTPPLGSTIAKVVVENQYYGKKEQSDEEVIFDYVDSCKDILAPETSAMPVATIDSIANAYDQCIDNLADLYCSPVTSPTGQVPEGTPPPRVGKFSISEDRLYPGDEYRLSWLLQGIGTYRLILRGFGQDRNLAETQFSETEKKEVLYSGQIDAFLASNIERLEFVLIIFDKDGQQIENGILTKTVLIERLPLVKTPSRKEFQRDNDPSDAKKEIYYLSQNVADRNLRLSDYKNANLNTQKTNFNSKDITRENMGSFWVVNDEETKLVYAFKQNPNRIIDVGTSDSTIINNIRPATEQRFAASFGNLNETVPFSFRQDRISPEELQFWQNNMFPTDPTLDIAYSYQKPYTKKEASLLTNRPSNFSIIEQKAEYNFYNRKYEEVHFDIDENLLPNMYFVSLNRDALRRRENNQAEDDFTLDPDIRKLVAVDDKIIEEESKQPVDISMYYDYYIKQVRQTPITDSELIDRTKNIYIPYNFLNKISSYDANSEMHPMKIEVSFSKPSRSTIASILKQSQIGEQVMLSCLTKFQKNTVTREFDTIKQEFDGSETNFFQGTNRYIGMDAPMSLTGSSVDEFIYLGDYRTFNDSQAGGQRHRFDFQQFSNNLHYIIKDKIRTYGEILEGKKCYRETLYYRIAKYDGEKLVQNIWIPNDPEQDTVKYIDTQVKYDKTYKYKIYTYDFVLGNSYKSINNDFLNMLATISNTPKLFLVENIFDELEAKVKDRPPLRPSIDIHSYIGVDNKVLFLLGKNFGTRKEKEIQIGPEDQEKFQQIRESQNLEQDDLIEFSGDDIIKEYEIYRLDVAPKTYKDFETAKRIKISTQVSENDPDRRRSLVSFVDSIKPNKKYYYTCRCADIHEQLSNPSHVIELEMINENGTVFLLKNQFKFEKQNRKTPTKKLKRFLMVKPDALQETFQIQQGASKNAVELKEKIKEDIYSSQEENIWGKKYKLRLVSKNTNKVYDINFKFGVESKIIE